MASVKKRIHFVGIGGIGMSALAKILAEDGYSVSGSDKEPSVITGKLQQTGVKIYYSHAAGNIPKETSTVVYSTCISRDNPELVEARRRKIKIVHRSEVLGWIFNKKKGIAVTGTHGKTTTTSLVSVMLENTGRDPTVMIGGEVKEFDGNAKLGKGDYAVAEADESDSSFLRLNPYYAVITNMEPEHLDHYKNMAEIARAFKSFIGNVKRSGVVFYNHDDVESGKVVKRSGARSRSFGFSSGSDIYPLGIKMDCFKTEFDCVYEGNNLGRVRLNIPGKHNVLNALACILVGLEMGIKFADIAKAICGFEGALRRFQLRCDVGGIMLVDDYAHHPTEIRAVIQACRNWKGRRVVAVFQPHRYTRTKLLANEFGKCFELADKIILTDIYAASEKPIKGVSIKMIYDKIKRSGKTDVSVIKKELLAGHVKKIAMPGDMILILGAGDIVKVADELQGNFESDSGVNSRAAEELEKRISGRVRFKEDLFKHTSIKIGGPAQIWAEPRDRRDLSKILAFARVKKLKVFVIGNGSNILAKDEGFNGIIISLSAPYFKKLKIKGLNFCVGAGHSLSHLVRTVCKLGLGGLESMVGIPGTVGGAIFMNAGGYSNPVYRNIGEFVTSIKAMDYGGVMHTLKRKDLEFGYRCSNITRYIILEADLRLNKTDRKVLISNCSHFLNIKRTKQALDLPSAGCAFKNPPGSQFTSGQMIDTLGLKGMRIGGAQISEKHANFIVNRGGATSKDVMTLVDLIQDKVKDNYGIDLELEIKVI